MSDEQQPVDKGVQIPDNSNPATERALGNGWMEEPDWEAAGKDPADWVSAREFNIRGELMGKIQGMGRKLNNLEQENNKLLKAQAASTEVTRKMVEKQYEKAMTDLKAQRREAYEVGDFEALDDIDTRRDELKAKRDEMDVPPEPVVPAVDISTMHPIERAFMDIVQTTPELQGNPDAARKVGEYADTIWGSNPEISVLEFTRKVDAHMNPPREPGPQAPDGNRNAGRPRRAGSKYSAKDLDEMELDMAKTFEATIEDFSIQDYVDQLAKTGSLNVQQER